jgi:hypothetical protein
MPGAVNDWAIAHRVAWPIHPSGLTVRTQLLRAVGGWGAATSSADVAMLAAVSELNAGYNDPTVNWLYRHHATHRGERLASGWWLQDDSA